MNLNSNGEFEYSFLIDTCRIVVRNQASKSGLDVAFGRGLVPDDQILIASIRVVRENEQDKSVASGEQHQLL